MKSQKNNLTLRLEVQPLYEDVSLKNFQRKIQTYLNLETRLQNFSHRHVYLLEAPSDSVLSKDVIEKVFCDPLLHCYQIFSDGEYADHQKNGNEEDYSYAIEIFYRYGVTDNSGKVAAEALALVGEKGVSVSSGSLYFLGGQLNQEEVENIAQEFLANHLVQQIKIFPMKDFYRLAHSQNFSRETQSQKLGVEVISLHEGMEKLLQLNEVKGWAFNELELIHIRDYFLKEEFRELRALKGLPKNPTDVEMEILAQTWSEHCKHKIFNADIKFSSDKVSSDTLIHSLFKTYIRGATEKVLEKNKIDWTVSLFTDNAGTVRFDSHLDLSIKVETHNSPSALDPYGGALTGILGVNRDILGCGMGAKPIANTDVFCLCPTNTPGSDYETSHWPPALKHPRRILEGVHRGVADGGNKSGIPTVNGSIFFDDSYAGRPLIFCGTVGISPRQMTIKRKGDGRPHLCWKKDTRPGDLIVVIGGAVGKDGIHGATLSSLIMNESTPSSMVQIGDPLTQKRVLDFLLEARECGLYSGLTDNGAGGLSSSVGEMALMSGGASLDLIHCPLKYAGIAPYEIMISESQERMTLSVPQENWSSLQTLAEQRGVAIHQLGTFDNSQKLQVFYGGEVVACLPLDFLHHSLPPLQLTAKWNGPLKLQNEGKGPWRDPKEKVRKFINYQQSLQEKSFYEESLLALLQAPNVASKESWVRQYDHEVQGATVLTPFNGSTGEAPSDAAVIALAPHGGDEKRGVVIGHGLNPKISHENPYLMAFWAVDEAIRNNVAAGGDPDKTCLVDNFCWPDPIASQKNPDGETKLGQLVLTCQGLHDAVLLFGTPLVSGKDSMKNDFYGKDGQGRSVKISATPTLLVTAMSDIEDFSKATPSAFRQAGDLIYVLGKKHVGCGWNGSEFSKLYTWEGYDKLSKGSLSQSQLGEKEFKENLQLYRTLYQASRLSSFQSVHDISDGGLLVAIAESMMGEGLGVQLELDSQNQSEEDDLLSWSFQESPGRFIVSLSPDKAPFLEQLLRQHGCSFHKIGKVTGDEKLSLKVKNKLCMDLPLEKLRVSWRSLS